MFAACAKWHTSVVEDSPMDELSRGEMVEKHQSMEIHSSVNSVTRLGCHN